MIDAEYVVEEKVENYDADREQDPAKGEGKTKEYDVEETEGDDAEGDWVDDDDLDDAER